MRKLLTIAATTFIRAGITEAYRANNELLALGIGPVAAISGQEAIDLTPYDLWCRPTAKYTL